MSFTADLIYARMYKLCIILHMCETAVCLSTHCCSRSTTILLPPPSVPGNTTKKNGAAGPHAAATPRLLVRPGYSVGTRVKVVSCYEDFGDKRVFR